MAGNRANLEAKLAPVRTLNKGFLDAMDLATQEMGGLGPTAAEAYVKGTSAQLNSMVNKMPNVQAFYQQRQAMSIALGSFINQGRPTDADAQAASAALPDLKYTAATNAALNKFWENVMASGALDTATSSSYKSIVAKGKSIIDADQKYLDWAKKNSIPRDQINSDLEEMHKARGL